jgi:DNA-binding LacI/PurR family transcriptional regulator
VFSKISIQMKTPKSDAANARQWKQRITEAWFRSLDAPIDPLTAYRDWNKWISSLIKTPRKRGPGLSVDERVRRYLIESGTGLSNTSVKNYLNRKHHQIGDARFEQLCKTDEKLGFAPLERVTQPPVRILKRRAIRRIALVTEFRDLPSLSYHQRVIRSLLESGETRNASLVIHEVSRPNLDENVAHFVRIHQYDALIFIRLTPSENLCALLARERIPVVTVHSDIRPYPSPPVLANIVPRQHAIGKMLRGYIADTRRGTKVPARVVLIHMRKEDTPGSIRDERIACLASALADPRLGLQLVPVEVKDYSFPRAFEVYQKHVREKLWPAQFYVCLSNELALGIRCLLLATIPESKSVSWTGRIIGFDNRLPPDEGIASFDQHLDRIGPEVMAVLDEFFERQTRGPAEWPEFEVRGLPVSLTLE